MDAVVTILVFFVVISIAAVVFGGWVMVSIIRLTFMGFRGMARCMFGWGPGSCLPQGQRGRPSRNVVRCDRQGCGAENPAGASFCRRCGKELPRPQRVMVRRVAMW